MSELYPVQKWIVEDVAAKTSGKKKWDQSFSPLEVGKKWFYDQLEFLAPVETVKGYETAELRKKLGLKKSSNKLAETFDSHNVDSWVMANYITGSNGIVDNRDIVRLIPLQFHRRQLQVFQPSKDGIRKSYGGTRSLGFKRGSIVRHSKYGISYVGGTTGERISLHDVKTGKRLTQNAKTDDVKFLAYNSWRVVYN